MMDEPLRTLLEEVAAGRVAVEDALERWPQLAVAHVGEFARLDMGRLQRKGVPEVIYGPGKTPEQFLAIVQAFVRERGVALASRVDAVRRTLVTDWAESACARVWEGVGGALEVSAEGYRPQEGGGVVGILTAGTSDIPVAEEVSLVARHMGCRVTAAYDVGVAGVHRLLEPLTELARAEADVVVVVAGMEGALASVVAGLVSVPVVGVPVSSGYGAGGAGKAALYSMLQTCTPGLVVVNIDNGVGAGAAAGLIARRVALWREEAAQAHATPTAE